MSANVRTLSMVAGITMAVGLVIVAVAGIERNRMRSPDTADLASGSRVVAAGRMAPDFTLTSTDGKIFRLADLRGKVVFLNLWATWCPPCRQEMPSIQSLEQAFKKNPDFVTLTVSEDTDVTQPPVFIKKYKYDFTVLLDPRNDVGEAYGVSGLPESFVIGRDGRIVAHHVGPYDWANPDIREALQDLLKSKPG